SQRPVASMTDGCTSTHRARGGGGEPSGTRSWCCLLVKAECHRGEDLDYDLPLLEAQGGAHGRGASRLPRRVYDQRLSPTPDSAAQEEDKPTAILRRNRFTERRPTQRLVP